jgi:hypothetical protein
MQFGLNEKVYSGLLNLLFFAGVSSAFFISPKNAVPHNSRSFLQVR